MADPARPSRPISTIQEDRGAPKVHAAGECRAFPSGVLRVRGQGTAPVCRPLTVKTTNLFLFPPPPPPPVRDFCGLGGRACRREDGIRAIEWLCQRRCSSTWSAAFVGRGGQHWTPPPPFEPHQAFVGKRAPGRLLRRGVNGPVVIAHTYAPRFRVVPTVLGAGRVPIFKTSQCYHARRRGHPGSPGQGCRRHRRLHAMAGQGEPRRRGALMLPRVG